MNRGKQGNGRAYTLIKSKYRGKVIRQSVYRGLAILIPSHLLEIPRAKLRPPLW